MPRLHWFHACLHQGKHEAVFCLFRIKNPLSSICRHKSDVQLIHKQVYGSNNSNGWLNHLEGRKYESQ